MIEIRALSDALGIIELDDQGRVALHDLISEAIDEIRHVRSQRDRLGPCVVVLTSQDLPPADAQRIVEAGGFVGRRPEGFTEALRADDTTSAIDLLLGVDWTPGWRDAPGASGQYPTAGGDLKVYENPPFQLDRVDYDRWLERMRTPPEQLDD
jgi:hypothetical protein